MSAKHLKAVALALVALLLLWGATELFSRGTDKVTDIIALPRLAQGDVDTVAIVHAPDTILVVKWSATVWTVNGHPASSEAVNDFFRAFRDSVNPELIAQRASSFTRLGVDSAGGRWLRVAGGGKTLVWLIVGGRGSEYASAYVRQPGDSHVYLWHGQLPGMVERGLDDWRERKIAEVIPDSVQAVEIERGKDRYALRRQGKAWTLSGRGAADSGAVVQLLERYRAVTASGFASPRQADSAKAMRPSRRLIVRGSGGSELLSLVFDSIPGGFWVRRAGDTGSAGGARVPSGEAGTVYRMEPWQVNDLTPARELLLKAKQ